MRRIRDVAAADDFKELDSGFDRRWLWGGAATALCLLAWCGWYLLAPSAAARIAARTIAMQEELLVATLEPAARRKLLEEIMRNVDRLPPEEVRRVRERLFSRLGAMRQESLSRFADASATERLALLDEDLDRIRLARGVLDATDQGGMRPFTEAELQDREDRRKQRAETAKKPAVADAKAKRPAAAPKPAPRPSPEEQKQATEYMEALTKRAKEKKVELGRMFSRPPGRG